MTHRNRSAAAPLVESTINTRPRRSVTMKALTWKYDESKENLSDHRSVTRSQSKSKAVAKISDMKDAANNSKASPYPTIRSPDHWLDYPEVITGAIKEVTEKMNNPELRAKVIDCLIDVMNNKSSLLAAYQQYFVTEKKSTSTPRHYLRVARESLTAYLGENNVDLRIVRHLNKNTTYEELKRIHESTIKNTKIHVGYQNSNTNTSKTTTTKSTNSSSKQKQTTSRAYNNMDAKAINSSIRRKAGLEDSDSDDDHFEDESIFKTPPAPTKRSATGTNMKGRDNSSGAEKRPRISLEKEKESSQEEEAPPSTLPSVNGDAAQPSHANLRNSTSGRNTEIGGTHPGNSVERMQVARRDSSRLRMQMVNPNGQQMLFSAPNRKPQHFKGTVKQLHETIKKVLNGNYGGNLNDMADVLTESVVKEHRMAKALRDRNIPFDLLLASFNYCCRFIALESIEIIEDMGGGHSSDSASTQKST